MIRFLLLAFFASAAMAQYPSKPVRFIVPSASGGGTDIIARALAEKLSQAFGRQFIVDNRPGAGQMIGLELAAKSAPDGHTLVMAASALALNSVMYKKVPYDALRDFAPITQAATLPNVLVVHPSVPARSIAELIAHARQRPGELNYASAGIGTSPQMAIELLKSMAGIDMVHVPYKGTTPGVMDLLGGQVALMAPNLLTALPHIKAGKLRALGVTSAARTQALPDVPAIGEVLPGYEAAQWYGVLAPAGTPGDIVSRLYAEMAKALRHEEVKERLVLDGAEAVGSSPGEFAAFIRSEIAKWTQVARAANIRPE